MISYNEGIVKKIIQNNERDTIIEVMIDGRSEKAVNYNDLTGKVKINDKVILNTTAVDLDLGTGGVHFVIHNARINNNKLKSKGHIIKLRYTPMQLKCLAVEEEQSPYYNEIKKFKSLEESIVLVGSLHSMLAPISAMIKYIKPNLKINYIMTDGGALPIQFSYTVKKLKKKKIIDKTITIGHSFGGDYECINIYTGLITSKQVLKSDITIVTMGPGIVGTGTKYGFSGIEQGQIIDVVNKLGGKSFIIPRVSYKEKRERHRGISHHTITNLKDICFTRTNLILPLLDEWKNKIIEKQVDYHNIDSNHNISYEYGDKIKEALDYYNLNIKTMNRDFYNDKDYFLTLGAVAKGVCKVIK